MARAIGKKTRRTLSYGELFAALWKKPTTKYALFGTAAAAGAVPLTRLVLKTYPEIGEYVEKSWGQVSDSVSSALREVRH